MKILDVMIKKGKGPMFGKLRIIELIKSDVQILIRIIVNQRNKGKIKSNPRIAKSNYRSRSKYSIENVILKKD